MHTHAHLRPVEDPEPPLQLLRVEASVDRVELLQDLPAALEIGGGCTLPSAERRVRLVPCFGLEGNRLVRRRDKIGKGG